MSSINIIQNFAFAFNLLSLVDIIFISVVFLESVQIHFNVEQLPHYITNERSKTAISKEKKPVIVFNNNDDAAELLPD